MKVAVTSDGTTLESNVDPRFGRCSYFVVVDQEAETINAVSNDQNLNASSGAGIQAAEMVVKAGAEAVITGHCGPKAFKTLFAAGVKVYTGAEGSLVDVMEKFNSGQLVAAEAADVDGHW